MAPLYGSLRYLRYVFERYFHFNYNRVVCIALQICYQLEIPRRCSRAYRSGSPPAVQVAQRILATHHRRTAGEQPVVRAGRHRSEANPKQNPESRHALSSVHKTQVLSNLALKATTPCSKGSRTAGDTKWVSKAQLRRFATGPSKWT